MLRQASCPFGYRLRFPQTDAALPFDKGNTAHLLLHGPVKGIILQPVDILLDEAVEILPFPVIVMSCPPVFELQGKGTVPISFGQQQVAPVIQIRIADPGRIPAAVGGIRLLSADIFQLDQFLRIDKLGIARKGRKRLIG